MVYDITSQAVLAFVLVLFRVGGMLSVMPAFGEQGMSSRVRIGLAVSMSFIMLPLVEAKLQPIPLEPVPLIAMGVTEALIGLIIGSIMRLVMMATQMAGTIIAFQLSLGFVTAVDPTQGTQGAIIGSFLALLASVLIFTTGLHHVLIAAIYDSYEIFNPRTLPDIGDTSQLALKTIAEAFVISVKMSAPFLVFGLIFYAGLGVISKLMPQIQIFFVAIPANIWIGLIMFALLLHVMMTMYMAHVEDQFIQFTQ